VALRERLAGLLMIENSVCIGGMGDASFCGFCLRTIEHMLSPCMFQI
jgi:hypothetical protein